ncbi:MAG: aminomethyltransferase family protein, partial [Pseudomonadota bacterium]
PAGRPLKKAPAYDAMTAAGCQWGASWGLELPLYFAPTTEFEETPTLKRSNAFDIVADECKATRETVGLLDISGFSRFEVSGAGAQAWLDSVMACQLPKPGRAKLAPMLSPEGKLKGDLTVFNWGDGTWWIMGSYYLREWHERWYADHMGADVELRDISDATVGFSLSGPKSRAVLETLTDGAIGDLPFMGCGTFDIGMLRVKVGRLSVTGELGYELHCSAAEHITLRETLLEAGAQFGMREIGFNALLSLRLEKSFGIWSAEFTQAYTPGQTGMDRWIAWDKGNFVGREAAKAERDSNQRMQRVVTLEVDATDADASGFEPVWHNGAKVGFVTSGGFGHTIGKSLALAMVDDVATAEGTELSVHIVGQERAARVIANSPYDPQGKAMRA